MEAPQRTGAAPEPLSWEPLSRGAAVCVSRVHRFSTDTILLADFSLPKRGETCAEFCAGCGALSLLWAVRAAPARVFAVELQQDAADLCRSSIARNGLAETVSALCANLRDRDALRTAFEPGSLDRIACNPPYQPAGTGVKSQIPGERLAHRREETCTFADAAASAGLVPAVGREILLLPQAGPAARRVRRPRPRRAGAKAAPPRAAPPRPRAVPRARGGRARRQKPGLRVLPVLIVESETGGWSPGNGRPCSRTAIIPRRTPAEAGPATQRRTNNMSGTLTVVGTPIGNLGDFFPRAQEALAAAHFIAAEDTRVTLKLLNHFGLKKPLLSYYEHNKRGRGAVICRRNRGGGELRARLRRGDACHLRPGRGYSWPSAPPAASACWPCRGRPPWPPRSRSPACPRAASRSRAF